MTKQELLLYHAEYITIPRDLRNLVFRVFMHVTLDNSNPDIIVCTTGCGLTIHIERVLPSVINRTTPCSYHTSSYSLIIL